MPLYNELVHAKELLYHLAMRVYGCELPIDQLSKTMLERIEWKERRRTVVKGASKRFKISIGDSPRRQTLSQRRDTLSRQRRLTQSTRQQTNASLRFATAPTSEGAVINPLSHHAVTTAAESFSALQVVLVFKESELFSLSFFRFHA
jgi:hypothetical protein